MVFSSTYMLQGLGEEKENRIMEVLLSSVSPRQLLTGKVLGLSAAGLVQVAVWMVSLPFLMNLASSSISGFAGTIQLPVGFLVFGVIYFILGYLLFTVLAAGIGAVSSTVQEGQQLATIYSIFAITPLWCMSLIILYPDSSVWTILTIFPLTAPVMVMERLGMINIPSWQIAASITVLVLSIIGGLLLAAKVFKAYLLSYGKSSKLKEIMRS
jgi:ABC-2 type transport system permease protein